MRILLDECVHRKLKTHLKGHDVWTAAEAGFAGKRNGELLSLVVGRFDAFITIDRNLRDQQNLSKLTFPVLLLVPTRQRFEFLVKPVPSLLKALPTAQSGCVTVIEADEAPH